MSTFNDQERDAIFAEEAFIVDAQLFLHSLMEEKGISRASLAKEMGVSRARVSQIFSDECKNFTMRLFARAAYALREKPTLHCEYLAAQAEQKEANDLKNLVETSDNVVALWQEAADQSEDECVSSNDQRLAGLRRRAA
jgi:transcriptional regulator with XRE-family HTH domain